ncbi:MAG TPA: phosphoribosyl-ATP diphosphatase [Devosiaceae bacterium]|nr:phosphoribosyl-ATP diphosphatase [Devosiaceae bacterium]
MAFSLTDLDTIIANRAAASPAESYTAKLLHSGVAKCAQKLGEEAVEAAIAAVRGDKAELTRESADLIYHLLVTLKAAGVPLADVFAELDARQKRLGQAGQDIGQDVDA